MTENSSVSEQLRPLTRLQDLSLKLSATLSLEDTLEAILEAAIAVCRADGAAISHFNELGDLRLLKHKGLSAEYVQQRHLTRLDPTLSGMMSDRLPSIIEDIDEYAADSPNHPVWRKEGIASIVTLPLVSEGKVFGIIGVGSRSVRRYSKMETDAMAILATQAGAAIVNARLFEQLREASRAKDEFLSTLSHELRTPLTPILGWTNLLKPFASLDPLLGQGLETIERNANQLLELIKDLLDLTRIISNKVELEREPTDLAALVTAAVGQMRPQAEARGVNIDLNLPGDSIIGEVDPMRIQQIISNLLGNAVKFTPEGGRASVVLKREGDRFGASERVVIEVIDTGVGIDPGFLPFIFERFTQGNEGIDRRFGGLGLGLAITRAMVELHGGEVTAESDGPGCGSRFTVRLPIISSAEAMESSDSVEPILENLKIQNLGLSILVIEDSPDTLSMLSLWLGTFGCEVLVAAEAMEGVRLATELRPDLIISDIGMPEVDGYALMRMLRKTTGLEQVPAIALTGYARDEDRELALAAGYNAHIPKPANMSHLLSLITKLTKSGTSRV